MNLAKLGCSQFSHMLTLEVFVTESCASRPHTKLRWIFKFKDLWTSSIAEVLKVPSFWTNTGVFLCFDGCWHVLNPPKPERNWIPPAFLPHSSRIPPNVLRFIMDPMAKHHGNHGDHGAVDPYSLEGLVQRHENRQLLLQRLSSVRQQIKDLEREVPEMLSVYGQI